MITYTGIGDEAGVSLRAQVAAMASLGWRAIELRTVDGVAVADLDDRGFAAVADALAVAGLDVVCLDSRIGNWARPISGAFDQDLDELAILSRRCAALGTPYLRIMSYPNDGLPEHEWRHRVIDRIRRLTDRAERAGIVLLHENCAGWAGASAERMLAMLDAVGSPALRLLFDTGNGMAYGYQAYAVLTEVVPHVAHVHVKDAKGELATPTNDAEGEPAAPVYTLPGAGVARVADCLRLLLAHGYTGAWSIEPHLALQPHAGGPLAEDAPARFVAAGTALRRLVRSEVLPHFNGWSQVGAGRIAGPVR